MCAKTSKRPRQTLRAILAPMLAVAERNGWTAILEALRNLLTRWEGRRGDE
jgi:hypothetical protein